MRCPSAQSTRATGAIGRRHAPFVPDHSDRVSFVGATGKAYSKRTGFGSKLLTLLRPVGRHPCFS
jgi:hypothetical protein